VRIEPVADWTRLALEAAKQSALQLQTPRMKPPEDEILGDPEDEILGDFEPVTEDTDLTEPHYSNDDDDESEPEPEAAQPAGVLEGADLIRAKVAALVGARQGQAANDKQRGLAVRMLEQCFGSFDADQQKEMRHRVLRYLFGVSSSKDLQGQHHLALLDWLKPSKDSDGKYQPSEGRILEARILEHAALLADGQGELFDDPLLQMAAELGGVVTEAQEG